MESGSVAARERHWGVAYKQALRLLVRKMISNDWVPVMEKYLLPISHLSCQTLGIFFSVHSSFFLYIYFLFYPIHLDTSIQPSANTFSFIFPISFTDTGTKINRVTDTQGQIHTCFWGHSSEALGYREEKNQAVMEGGFKGHQHATLCREHSHVSSPLLDLRFLPASCRGVRGATLSSVRMLQQKKVHMGLLWRNSGARQALPPHQHPKPDL